MTSGQHDPRQLVAVGYQQAIRQTAAAWLRVGAAVVGLCVVAGLCAAVGWTVPAMLAVTVAGLAVLRTLRAVGTPKGRSKASAAAVADGVVPTCATVVSRFGPWALLQRRSGRRVLVACAGTVWPAPGGKVGLARLDSGAVVVWDGHAHLTTAPVRGGRLLQLVRPAGR